MNGAWRERQVGEVIQLVYGKPLDDGDRKPDGLYPVYGANGEKDRTDRFYHDKPSIVVGRKGSAGELNLTEPRFWPLDVTYFVTFDDEQHDLRFLYYLLSTLDLPRLAKGVKPGINRNEVYSQTAHVPSLSEQKRIVGLLDEVFEGINTAKANAEQNLQNARALFESHLDAVFTDRGRGWAEKRLADVAEFKNGLNFTRQSKGQTLRMVGVGDFQEHSVVPVDRLQSVTIDGRLSDDYLIQRDDILMVRSNGSKGLVGRCMVVPDVDGMTSFSGFIIRVRFDTRVLNPHFLLHYMKSSATRGRLTRDGGGANISSINQAKLSELPVFLPPFKEQNEISNRLDGIREETQRLASLYERKLDALEALKQSLLHQAFAGKLAATGVLTARRPTLVVPPASLPKLSATDLHAGILAMAYELHDKQGKAAQFTHVKAEKIAHMVEATVGCDLGRIPFKDAAGPNDFPHLRKVEHRARLANFFDFKQGQGDAAYRVQKLRGFNRLVERTREALGDRLDQVEAVLTWMARLSVQQAEIVATVYAAWNNLLLDKKSPSDEEIVRESRENWHANKLKIDRDRFLKAILWLRKEGVVPQGTGKRVVAKGAP